MKIWAVGLRDWVQLRSSKVAPTALWSSSKKPYEDIMETPVYTEGGLWTGRMSRKKINRELVMKIVHFEGGKVKATLKRRSFTEKTNISIKEGEVREVPPDIARVLIADDWSQKIPQELGGPSLGGLPFF